MKRFFLIGIFFSFYAQGLPEIAFVHIGKKLPSYLKDAVKRARTFNKDANIYLLCENDAYELYEFKGGLEFDKVKKIDIGLLEISAVHQDFRKNYRCSPHFRDRFWINTAERFYYLHEFMLQSRIERLYHLENDTMLYVDLSQLESVFEKKYTGIAGVFENDESFVPCFMYIASSKKWNLFLEFMNDVAKKEPDLMSLDMRVQSDFRKIYGAEFLDYLPIIPREYCLENSLKDKQGRIANVPELYWNNIDDFNSIFDAAAIGIFFDGVDPRNRGPNDFGGPGYIHPISLVDTSKLQFMWITDLAGRKVPYLIIGNKKFRINNLHINSKFLHKFLSQ